MSTSQDANGHDGGRLRILVPLDGSRHSARAAAVAGQLPATEIVLLHIAQDDHDAEARGIQTQLEDIAAPLRSGQRTVEVVVRSGDIAAEILDVAPDCDLIVMTTHGRGAAGRILFGSVADRISRHSTTPTLLIRTGDETTDVPAPSRIVVPLDGSDLAERALPIAATIASGMPRPLHLLRAVGLDEIRTTIQEWRKSGTSFVEHERTYDEARQETERRATTYLAQIAEPLTAQGIEVHTQLLHGAASFELLWNIQPDDLVVITSHGRHGFRRWLLGSVAEKLVREAKAPVLLVPTRERKG